MFEKIYPFLCYTIKITTIKPYVINEIKSTALKEIIMKLFILNTNFYRNDFENS